jgi:hypothetical protein
MYQKVSRDSISMTRRRGAFFDNLDSSFHFSFQVRRSVETNPCERHAIIPQKLNFFEFSQNLVDIPAKFSCTETVSSASRIK